MIASDGEPARHHLVDQKNAKCKMQQILNLALPSVTIPSTVSGNKKALSVCAFDASIPNFHFHFHIILEL